MCGNSRWQAASHIRSPTFTSGRIFGFSWSRDGKQLFVAKGSETSDVVLISNFR